MLFKIPWFIPTKSDQRKWYNEELSDTPREITRILRDFQDVNAQYSRELGDFEEMIAKTELFERYIRIKQLAQEASFLWQRLEYKQKRQEELKDYLKEL